MAQEQLEQERSAAAAARERSRNAAAGGLADREEKAAVKAQLAELQAEVASLRAAAKVTRFISVHAQREHGHQDCGRNPCQDLIHKIFFSGCGVTWLVQQSNVCT